MTDPHDLFRREDEVELPRPATWTEVTVRLTLMITELQQRVQLLEEATYGNREGRDTEQGEHETSDSES